MSRLPLVAGNWKMHTTTAEAVRLVEAVLARPLPAGVEVAVCPPFTALAAVGPLLAGSPVRLGAQDVFWELQGAYTGEIAPPMLVDLGCHYVIVGHSERRQYFGETDQTVARKVRAAFAAGLVPIACVGERLDERDAGRTEEVVVRQIDAVAAELRADQVGALVVAYEPVWAIGTGRSALAADANGVIGLIRRRLAGRFGDAARQTRILYGGSVSPENIADFMREPEIDGALVGGASLKAERFVGIITAAAAAAGSRAGPRR